ncbi:hypothetical protein [Bacteroides sp.]|uniref:hypothetical protein n=1 Tax=Bacteroides sp. TaxID=29523 RepID=UPI0026298551|nr:hypothetical protein [Bacteroides sp.]MDD3036784.1 hypothetical protein [Bacteroides sp.]
MNKKNIIKNTFLVLGFLSMALASCTSEEEVVQENSNKEVKMIVKATRESFVETRTAHEEKDGNIKTTWIDGDQLLVTNSQGKPLGVITLAEGAGTKDGQFEGVLTGIGSDGTYNLNYFYFGKAIAAPAEFDGNMDFSTQKGLFTNLADYDVFSSSINVEVKDGESYVDNIGLQRNFLFAHFALNLPDGVIIKDEVVTISGDNLKNKVAFSFSSSAYTASDGSITVTNSNGDFYINLIPAEQVALNFSVTIADVEYTGLLTSVNLNRNAFIRKADKLGIPVQMTPTEEPEKPNNPGNTGSWGGDDFAVAYTTGTLTKVANADGWTTNVDIYSNGGFGTQITYTSNGIKNNLLTSNGGTAFFFQWGRWLGFPSTCGRTKFNSGGSISGNYPNDSQYLAGVNIYNTKLGYTFNNGLVPAYGACYMGNSSWTKQRALNSSIMFGMVQSNGAKFLDYIGTNEQCTWNDRSGNPCPDGYRIPTADELSAFIPSGTDQINESYAEIKTVNGTKYAMEWKVNTSNSLPCVEIRSVRTFATTVAVGDAIFNNAKIVKLYAYGYLNNQATLSNSGTIGVYWSCESGTASSQTGNGGKYLEIDFNNKTAVMSISVADRCFGACILPIKDTTSKAASLTPWLPLSGL